MKDKIKHLLEYAIHNNYNEIYIEDLDHIKKIVFDKNIYDIEYIETNKNKEIEIELIYEKNIGKEKVSIYTITKDSNEILENLDIKIYQFKNKFKNSLFIKLLNYNIPVFQKILTNFKDKNVDKKLIYNYLINPNISGINIISSNSNDSIKLFLYSLIKEINNTINTKILSYETFIEKQIQNKKGIIIQKELNEDLLKEIQILNPNIIFIEENLTDEILYWAYKLANWNKKVIITTSITESKIITNQIEQVCNKYNILQTNFNENTLSYVNLNKNKEIDHIFFSDDLY